MNNKNEKISNPFSIELYNNLSLDELVTYCIFRLLSEKKEATFENIVAKSFELFPDKFSLSGYPIWPDSARVNKSWLRCRTDFKYIEGSVKRGFKLTEKGHDIVKKVQFQLDRPISERQKLSFVSNRERTREEVFLKEISKSIVFLRYIKNKENTQVSHFEFCDVLFCTLESTPDALKENLIKLKDYSNRFNRTDIFNFLVYLESKFRSFLINKNDDSGFIMGMIKKKK